MQQFLTELYLYLEACHSVDVFACVLDIDMFLTRMRHVYATMRFLFVFFLPLQVRSQRGSERSGDVVSQVKAIQYNTMD